MMFAYWLSVGAGALLILAFVLHKRRRWMSPIYWHTRYFFLYFIAYPLFIRRRYWSSVTLLQALVFVALLGVNGTYVGVPLPSHPQAARRLGRLAALHMIPLFVSHANPIVHLILPLHVHQVFHHWIGRLCIAQGIVHSILMLAPTFKWDHKSISGLMIMVTLACMGLHSICIIRRWNWELFVVVHLLLALTGISGLIWHLKNSEVLYFSLIGLGLWVLMSLPRVWNLKMKNNSVTVRKFYRVRNANGRPISDLDVIQLKIFLERPVTIGPGQHIYLRIRDRELGERFQRHPFMISWWESPAQDIEAKSSSSSQAAILVLLIQPASGLTRRLANQKVLKNVSFDGPYGQNLNLETYNNVILVAKGIGIAGVLSYAKQFLSWKLEPSQKNRVITRKLDLYWELDDTSQEEWAAPFLRSLQNDNHNIWLIKIWCFFPSTIHTAPLMQIVDGFDDYKYIFPDNKENMASTVESVAAGAVGRNIIVACGVSSFTRDVRKWAKSAACPQNVVEFVEVEYRPSKRVDESPKEDIISHQLDLRQSRVRRLDISRPVEN